MTRTSTLLAATCALALAACAAGPAGTVPTVTPTQVSAAQAVDVAVCNTEQVYADPKAADAAKKRCAAEQAALGALQVAAGVAAPASAPR